MSERNDRPKYLTLESIYQSVPALSEPLTDTAVVELAWDERAVHVARKGLPEKSDADALRKSPSAHRAQGPESPSFSE